jgi:hypothetical protein
MIQGYNISLSIGGYTVLGRTQEDFNLTAKVKESITKDDAGVTQRKVTGHDATFRVTALLSVTETGSPSTAHDRDAFLALALATGDSAKLAFIYAATGATTTLYGNAIITGYSESSSADPDSDTTITLDLQVIGEPSTSAPTP